jgi:hypothetical protein
MTCNPERPRRFNRFGHGIAPPSARFGDQSDWNPDLQAWTFPAHEQIDIRWHDFSIHPLPS